MSWWEVVSGKVNPGDKLFTPGRGLQGLRKKPFSILSKDPSKIIIASGSSRIPLDRICFDTIERAFHKNPYIWLRVAALRDNEPLKDSADKLIREAAGSELARGNYVCSILEHCGLVRYSMRGNRKGIELAKERPIGKEDMGNQSGKIWYKNYHFWTLVVTSLTLVAITYFAWQSQRVQKVLESIEATREKEKFCDDLKIYFNLEPSPTSKPEAAKYDLKIINNSSHIYESLKTSVVVLFQNPKTKEIKKAEVFTFPARILPPSDKPVYLVDNPKLTDTFQFNISEAKKNIPETFKAKYFCFCFQWQVNIGDGEYLAVEKHKDFVVAGCK